MSAGFAALTASKTEAAAASGAAKRHATSNLPCWRHARGEDEEERAATSRRLARRQGRGVEGRKAFQRKAARAGCSNDESAAITDGVIDHWKIAESEKWEAGEATTHRSDEAVETRKSYHEVVHDQVLFIHALNL